MNWKNIASMILASATVAAVIAVQHTFAPLAPTYIQLGIPGAVGAVIHKINIWGGIPETTSK